MCQTLFWRTPSLWCRHVARLFATRAPAHPGLLNREKSVEWMLWMSFGAVAASALTTGYLLARRKTTKASKPLAKAESSKELAGELALSTGDSGVATTRRSEPLATALVFGTSAGTPAVTVRPLPQASSFQDAKPMNQRSPSVIGRLSALAQAAPGVLVAAEHAGRHLMEVTINGNLVRASDGLGFRAFAMGQKGIAEHAKLLDVGNLTSMVNAAAIWQVASVLVAQKHLADISAKLDSIKREIEKVSAFLNQQRRAKIVGTKGYLEQLFAALDSGSIPEQAHVVLETVERDMLEVQNHLFEEFVTRTREKIQTDSFGSEQQTNSVLSKLHDMRLIASDLDLCLKVRTAAWYLVAVLPGTQALQEARKRDIDKAYARLEELSVWGNQVGKLEAQALDAFWNREKTLESRRQQMVSVGMDTSREMFQLCKSPSIERVGILQALETSSKDQTIMLAIENGEVVEIRTPLQ